MFSSQNMITYTNIEQESDLEKPGDSELERRVWPNSGKIEFEEATMNDVADKTQINNLSFKVQGGMLVGILGSFKSGKCSIHKSLLRLCELEAGRVSIDGVDVKTLGLHFLRKSIAYIP